MRQHLFWQALEKRAIEGAVREAFWLQGIPSSPFATPIIDAKKPTIYECDIEHGSPGDYTTFQLNPERSEILILGAVMLNSPDIGQCVLHALEDTAVKLGITQLTIPAALAESGRLLTIPDLERAGYAREGNGQWVTQALNAYRLRTSPYKVAWIAAAQYQT